ncbi:MAG: DUF2007 domain-containing protein [Candidatus Omnitrophica bacterium]|nr:DUF2007 domain-containing protein [Candidatus Omnitrophota bacterium]
MSKKWVNIYTIFDDLEGPQLEAMLKENNIPVEVLYHQATSVYSIFQPSIGKGEIRVREDYVEEAMRLITEFKK